MYKIPLKFTSHLSKWAAWAWDTMTVLELSKKHWGLQAYVLRALNNKNALAFYNIWKYNYAIKAPKTQDSDSKSYHFSLD